MSLPAHVTIFGKKNVPIEGSCDHRGREGTILVDHVSHKIDLQKGEANGNRVHHPLCITKRVDTSSPKLHHALVGKELLTVEVHWYRIDPSGREEHYYTHKLEDALITSIETDMEVEKVSFRYSRITWKHETGSGGGAIETSDEWT